MGQDIDPALNGDFDSLIVGNVGKDRFPSAVGFIHDRLCQIQRHGQNAILLDGICKNLDAVRAVVNLLPHSPYRLRT